MAHRLFLVVLGLFLLAGSLGSSRAAVTGVAGGNTGPGSGSFLVVLDDAGRIWSRAVGGGPWYELGAFSGAVAFDCGNDGSPLFGVIVTAGLVYFVQIHPASPGRIDIGNTATLPTTDAVVDVAIGTNNECVIRTDAGEYWAYSSS